jgi:hypothetical protein
MSGNSDVVDLGDRRRKAVIQELWEARKSFGPLVEWHEWRAEVERILIKHYGELPDDEE